MQISFIIPVYNIQNEINSCIDSIIDQYDNNFEIILVNDGSNDDSEKICIQYENKYNFVKLISINNSGVSIARNVGLQIADGDYISFIDGDDKISKNYVKEVAKYIASHSPEILQIGYERISDFNPYAIVPKFNRLYRSVEVFHKFEMFTHSVWSYVFKRELIVKYNIVFSNNLKYSEDQEFLLKFLIHTNKIFTINKILYFYIDRSSSVVNKSPSFERATNQLIVAFNILKYFHLYKYTITPFYRFAISQLIDDFFIYSKKVKNLHFEIIQIEYYEFYFKAKSSCDDQLLSLYISLPKFFNKYFYLLVFVNLYIRKFKYKYQLFNALFFK